MPPNYKQGDQIPFGYMTTNGQPELQQIPQDMMHMIYNTRLAEGHPLPSITDIASWARQGPPATEPIEGQNMPPNYQPGMSIFDLVRQLNPQPNVGPQQGPNTQGWIPQDRQPTQRPAQAQMPPPQVTHEYGGYREAVIDRFEGDRAVVSIKGEGPLIVPRMKLPPGVQAGDWLRVISDGNSILSAQPDYEKTAQMRQGMGAARQGMMAPQMQPRPAMPVARPFAPPMGAPRPGIVGNPMAQPQAALPWSQQAPQIPGMNMPIQPYVPKMRINEPQMR